LVADVTDAVGVELDDDELDELQPAMREPLAASTASTARMESDERLDISETSMGVERSVASHENLVLRYGSANVTYMEMGISSIPRQRGRYLLPSDAKVIAVDDHVIEHPRVWPDRLPAKHADVAPRIVTQGGVWSLSVKIFMAWWD
jgi:hypothetical protein